MKWTCDKCGFSLDVKTKRVFCRCGAVAEVSRRRGGPIRVDTVDTGQPIRAAAWEIEARLQACHQCKEFMPSASDRCKQIDLGCSKTFRATIRNTLGKCPRDKWTPVIIPWHTTAELTRRAYDLAPQIPKDVVGIVGVPRSGMIPAATIATRLHLPLYTIVDGKIEFVRGGVRALELQPTAGRLAVVEDSIGSGTQWAQMKANGVLRDEWFFVSVFVSPGNEHKAQLYDYVQGTPHLFEWNFFNGPQVTLAALDMDGVLCKDGQREVYDGGTRELEHLQSVQPLDVPRNVRFRAAGIVTARLEKYRAVTEAWLKQQGAQYRELVMWPGKASERNLQSVAAWKVNACRELDVSFYVESDESIVREMRRRHFRVLDMHEGCLR
jgi:hypothetical protein